MKLKHKPKAAQQQQGTMYVRAGNERTWRGNKRRNVEKDVKSNSDFRAPVPLQPELI